MLGAFFAWWFEQLAALLPGWLRRPGAVRSDALVVAPLESSEGHRGLMIWLRRNGRETPYGQFPLAPGELDELPRSSRRPTVVKLARADLLEKSLSLPLAAQPELEQVLAFEMDRETPFTPDDVYWSHRIEAVDRANAKISVRLFLLPKTSIAALIETLAEAGIAPAWAEVADGEGNEACLPLNGRSQLQRRPSQRLMAAAAVCCALLAIAAAAIPIMQQAATLTSLEREIAAGQATAKQAEALRREIDALARGADLVNGGINKAGRPLETIAAVTRLLPDDTYLTEMELRQRKLTLSGRSAGAARLIGVLAGDGRFHNPSFVAPVTRVEALHAEVFTIAAEIESER